MTNKKFKLTKNTKILNGITLYQVQSLESFRNVRDGELGGWVEKESNLNQSGDAWVSGNAWVSGDAWVSGNAWVYGDARVYGNAEVSGDARVSIPVTNIIGLTYGFTAYCDFIQIGCILHTIPEWKKAIKDKAYLDKFTSTEDCNKHLAVLKMLIKLAEAK